MIPLLLQQQGEVMERFRACWLQVQDLAVIVDRARRIARCVADEAHQEEDVGRRAKLTDVDLATLRRLAKATAIRDAS
jgi:Rad3-related DNA helicase